MTRYSLIVCALVFSGCAAKLAVAPPPPLALHAALPSGVIGFRLSPAGPGSVPRLLNKRLSGVAMMWYVHAQNSSTETVNIYPSLVIGQAAHLEPYDYPSMLLLIGDAQTYSALARAGRIGQQGVKLGPYVLARLSKYVKPTWIEAGTGFLYALPDVLSHLQQVQRPVAQSFDALAWKDPIQLGPGATATAHLFTAPWSATAEYDFTVN